MGMNKDIKDYKYEKSVEDLKLKSFIDNSTPMNVDISSIKQKAFQKIRKEEKRRKNRRIFVLSISVAACFMLVMGIKFSLADKDFYDFGIDLTALFNSRSSIDQEELVVPMGEKTTLLLTDGTKIVANSRTIVRYPKTFKGSTREIYVKGEAYFDVAHDAEHPFIVNSDNFSVKVLGTKFNVSNYDRAESHVVLVQGSIELNTANHDRVRMKPKELVDIKDGGFTQKKEVNTDEYTCWMDGMINLDGECIQSVVKKLTNYYGVNIECDNNISSNKLYGKLVLEDSVTKVLSNIKEMAGVKMVLYGNSIRLVRK